MSHSTLALKQRWNGYWKHEPSRATTSKVRKSIFALAGLLTLAVTGMLVWYQPTSTPVPLPNPNGYDDFVKAGSLISGVMTNRRTASLEELRVYLEQNQTALKLARTGLTRQSRVPLAYSQNDFTNYRNDNGQLFQLALALKAEGRLAELEKRTNEAARIYLETIRIGHESSRGGFLFHGMTSQAFEHVGCTSLEPLTPFLMRPPVAKPSRHWKRLMPTGNQLRTPCARIVSGRGGPTAQSRLFDSKSAPLSPTGLMGVRSRSRNSSKTAKTYKGRMECC